MAIRITESVDVDIEVEAEEVVESILCGSFQVSEIKQIKEACIEALYSPSFNGASNPGSPNEIWRKEWIEIITELEKNNYSPFECREKLKKSGLIDA